MNARLFLLASATLASLIALAAVTSRAGDLEPPRGGIEPTGATLGELNERLGNIENALAAGCACPCPILETFTQTVEESDIVPYTGTRYVESFTVGMSRLNSSTQINLDVRAGGTKRFEILLQRGESRSYHLGAEVTDLRFRYSGTVPIATTLNLVSCPAP